MSSTSKETSDSPGGHGIEPATIVSTARKRTFGDYVALAVATCGVGLIPVAPGTWGAGVGVLLYLAVARGSEAVFDESVRRGLDLSPQMFPFFLTTALLLTIFVVSFAGVRAATRAERLLGKKDPGAVVVDEVAGQLVSFLFLPWRAGAWAVLLAFVAFRVFDIWKPYPIRRLEGLGGGLGIMADDLLAGFYAAAVMSLLVSIHTLLF